VRKGINGTKKGINGTKKGRLSLIKRILFLGEIFIRS